MLPADNELAGRAWPLLHLTAAASPAPEIAYSDSGVPRIVALGALLPATFIAGAISYMDG